MITKKNIFFMGEAIKASLSSNDPHCKVGALLVDGGGIVASACNYIDIRPLVRPEDIAPLMRLIEHNKTLKNVLCEHAEENLYRQYLKGDEIYVTKGICLDCARLVVKMGVKRAFMASISRRSKWHRTQMQALETMNKAGICVGYINVQQDEKGVPYLHRGGLFD